jgi:hypothetical protein
MTNPVHGATVTYDDLNNMTAEVEEGVKITETATMIEARALELRTLQTKLEALEFSSKETSLRLAGHVRTKARLRMEACFGKTTPEESLDVLREAFMKQ